MNYTQASWLGFGLANLLMPLLGLPNTIIGNAFLADKFGELIDKKGANSGEILYREPTILDMPIKSNNDDAYYRKLEQLGLDPNSLLSVVDNVDNVGSSASDATSLPNETLEVVPTIDNPSDYSSLVNSSNQMAEKEMLWNAEQARLAWERSEESAQRAFERTLEARRNQIPDLVESYKRAGLNPYLAYSSSGTGVSSPSATAYNSSYSGYANSLLSLSSNVRGQDITKLLGLLSSYVQMKGVENVTKQLEQSLGLGIAGNAVSILTALIKAFA